MIRVLHELASLDGGGVAKLLYDYFKKMDHSKICFDFLIYDYYEKGIFEDELQGLGCRIFKLTAYQKNKKKCLKEIEEVFRNNHYDIFHSHIGPQSIFSLYYAKKYGVKHRLVHSHLAINVGHSFKTKLSIYCQDQISKVLSTQLFACGRDAGIARWGRKAYKKGKVKIMPNAIDTSRFIYDTSERLKKRAELGLEGKLVLGTVGRLENQKNYPYVFKIVAELSKIRNDFVFLAIGRGPEEEQIKKCAEDLGIDSYIKFLGIRNDVPQLLNAIDIFLLPSLYEGLPVSLIEAQANGLPEIISDRITDEMIVTDLIRQLPIDEKNISRWVSEINEQKLVLNERTTYVKKVVEGGYEICVEALKMMDYYLSLQ